MSGPLVSIVIPSFNQGRFLRETLDSTLGQDYRPIEVLVIDGASKDESLDVLRGYHAPELQWWSEPDRGVTDAVNKGLARARGEILAVQSSDDVYLSGAVAAAVEAFEKEPRPGLVYGDVEYIDAESRVKGRSELPPFDLAEYVGKRVFVPQPAAFFTRAAAETAGEWRSEASYAADAEFYLRIATQHRVVKLDRLMARYRYHQEQRDRAGARIADDWEKVVRDWLAANEVTTRLRRKALSGIHLTRAHYLNDAHWARRTAELYRAILRDPSLLADPGFPHRELIPGREPIWKALSRVKRALGFAPRR